MTQSYIGTKQIMAWDQEKEGQQGYAVKYPDGYVSWSPKDVFEAAYLPMGNVGNLLPHQQRVVGEKIKLDDKIGKLSVFVSDVVIHNRLDSHERKRLSCQLDAMREYSAILAARIAAF